MEDLYKLQIFPFLVVDVYCSKQFDVLLDLKFEWFGCRMDPSMTGTLTSLMPFVRRVKRLRSIEDRIVDFENYRPGGHNISTDEGFKQFYHFDKYRVREKYQENNFNKNIELCYRKGDVNFTENWLAPRKYHCFMCWRFGGSFDNVSVPISCSCRQIDESMGVVVGRQFYLDPRSTNGINSIESCWIRAGLSVYSDRQYGNNNLCFRCGIIKFDTYKDLSGYLAVCENCSKSRGLTYGLNSYRNLHYLFLKGDEKFNHCDRCVCLIVSESELRISRCHHVNYCRLCFSCRGGYCRECLFKRFHKEVIWV